MEFTEKSAYLLLSHILKNNVVLSFSSVSDKP